MEIWSEYMPRRQRVLVTGGSGFIGRQILGYLTSLDAEIFSVSRRPFEFGTANVLSADLLSQSVVNDIVRKIRPDIVLHNAWFVQHGEFWRSQENLDWVASTMTLARACIRNSVRRFVGVGTCYEYAWPDHAACDETLTPTAGHLLYDRSKSAVRDLLFATFKETDVTFAWGRLFFLYGMHEAPGRLVASISRSLVANEVAKCSSGLAIRDFMDVRDAGAALGKLALSKVAGDINIATGIPIKISDVARMLGDISGKPQLIALGARPDQPEPPYIVGVNKRLTDEVKFEPRFSLEQDWKMPTDSGVLNPASCLHDPSHRPYRLLFQRVQ